MARSNGGEDDVEVILPPVRNGMDFLGDAVDELAAPASARSLKYSVLNLQAGTEVLLKARLIQFDWRLVFGTPADADRAEFEQGDFFSCRLNDAIDRLRKNVGITVPPQVKGNIALLVMDRNRLQHYGLISTAVRLRANAIPVLDFLSELVDEHLRPVVDVDDAEYIDAAMPGIRASLMQVQGLVAARLQRLQPELAAAGDCCVTCPSCVEPALVISGDTTVRCLLCKRDYAPEQAAEEYARNVQGRGWIPDGDLEPVVWECPVCDLPTVVAEVEDPVAPGTPSDFCFNRAERFTNLVPCEGDCGALVDRGEEIRLCSDCVQKALERL